MGQDDERELSMKLPPYSRFFTGILVGLTIVIPFWVIMLVMILW